MTTDYMLEHVSISHSDLKMRANFAASLLLQIEHVTLFWRSQTRTFLPCPLKWECRTKSNDVSKTQWKFSNVSPGSTKNSQIYLAACCRKPLCRRLSKFSWLQEGNIQISYVQDSPWLSWSASPLVAFWFAVAHAKPGLATSKTNHSRDRFGVRTCRAPAGKSKLPRSYGVAKGIYIYI